MFDLYLIPKTTARWVCVSKRFAEILTHQILIYRVITIYADEFRQDLIEE